MTDPRIQARRVRVERQRGHRRLGILLGVVLAAGAAAGSVAVAPLVAVQRTDGHHRRSGPDPEKRDTRGLRP